MFILILSIFTQLSKQDCVSIVDELYLYPSIGEYYNWELNTLFQGAGLTYKFADPQPEQLKLEKAVQYVDEPTDNAEPGSVMVTLVPFVQPANGAWLNHFVFLEYEAQGQITYDLHYAEGAVIDNNKTPEFANKVNFIANNNLMKCFDVQYLTSEQWVVDCAESQVGQPMVNYFYIVTKTDDPMTAAQKRQESSNPKNYADIQGRKILYHEYTTNNIGGVGDTINRILVRGQTAYNSETGTKDALDGDCIIEMYSVSAGFQMTDTKHYLDKAQLIKDLKIPTDEQATFQFRLIDFKFLPNGDLYILDAQLGILIYTISDTYEWKYKKMIQTYSELAIAMDVSLRFNASGTQSINIVVLYKQNLVVYVNGAQKNGYHLTKAVTYPARTYLSQNYIVTIYDKQLVLYSTIANLKIYQMGLLYPTVAINPYEPDLVQASNAKAYRYLLSHGYMSVISPTVATELGVYQLIATDENNNECKITIHSQALHADDTSIKSLNSDPFPSIITYPAEPLPLKQMASGPNLSYKSLTSTHVDVKVIDLWDLDIQGVKWPQASDMVFGDVIYEKKASGNRFYFLFQTKDYLVTIWDCIHEWSTDGHATCEVQDKFNAPAYLNNDIAQFDWYITAEEQLTILIREDDYTIGMYISHEGETERILQIQYPSQANNKITSFTVLMDVIYVVLGEQKIIDCYTGFYPTLTKFTITEAMVKEQGFTGNWSPKKVFGNQLIKAQLLFIQCEDTVIMGDYKYTFTLMKAMPILSGSTVSVAQGVETFFIVQKKGDQDVIDEYNYKNLNFIFKTKTLPLYNKFKIQTPLTCDFSSDTGYLMIRALQVETQTTVLLVFEPNVNTHDALLKVIPLDELIPDGSPLQLSITGGVQMFIYLNDQKSHGLLSFYDVAVLQLSPNQLSTKYVSNMEAGVTITNFKDATPLEVKYPIKFLNTQSIVSIQQNIINNENAQFVFYDKPESQYIQLNNNWYQGSILKFDISCQDCQSHLIELQQPVHYLTDGTEFESYTLKDGIQFLDNMVMYQSNYELIAQNSKDERAYVHKMTLPSNTYCHTLTQDTTSHVISGCLELDQPILYVSSCDATSCKTLNPATKEIPDTTFISKLMVKDGLLFVLNGLPSSPKLAVGNLQVYTYTVTGDSWDITNRVIIDKSTFDSTTLLTFVDFDIVTYNVGNVNYYKLFISELNNGLYTIDYSITGGKMNIIKKESIKLRAALDYEHVLKDSTVFYQVRNVESKNENSKLTSTIIITTNDVAHYGLTLKFDTSNPQNGAGYIQNSLTVPFLLNQYGPWYTLNKLSVYNGYVAIPFSDKFNLLVALYKIPKLEEGKSQMTTMVGGEKEEYYFPSTDFVMLLTKDNAGVETNPVLYANLVYSRNADNHMLIKYAVNDQPSLHVQNGHQVDGQQVQIKAYNDFSDASGSIIVSRKHKPDPDDPSDDNKGKGSSNWWWITLIVVFGVAAIGGAGFFVYQRYYKNRASTEPLIVN